MRPRQALLAAAALLPAALLTGTAAHATDFPTPWLPATASPSPSSINPWDCYSDQEDPRLRTTLDGLPGAIAVGSGWHGLTLKVLNLRDTAVEDVEITLTKVAYDRRPDMPTESPEYVDLQRQDPKSRAWVDIPFPDDYEGVLTTTDIAPRETLTFQLRLRVNRGVPLGNSGLPKDEGKGEGDVTAYARRLDDNGECTWSRDWEGFGIHEAGSHTANGNASTPPTDDLADTGPSSALPLLTLAGGAAVAVGGGTVYAVRRRRAGDGGS
ncbi:LPXTG cell wall anchor domain-containing protein [Streptomyces sp. DT2A-34]|uniref:LPXTG cell wall anchor domain-containing protein n=1 Tax=Streptomyces sp. DT2A-34 TaxID=3051182 RepID=UPI00265B9A4C|nr:LPXTG cell wall anchor domain-containing protein [Streptomyces sp. DT2A-34]MDO0914081.1 LPXTG cell wall anchor domain-containing protein [Streptomyces sp. DT2A-34]